MPPATTRTPEPRHGSPRGAQPQGNDDVLPVGSVLGGRYELEALLGEGGMGRVYCTRHLRTGRRYALKVLISDQVMTADAYKRFEREATMASAIGHPGIIQVHDYDQTEDGLHYLVMDLLQGETLGQRIERGPMQFAEARHWICQAAHDKNLVHRDIKPANLFLSRTGDGATRLVVLDFGVVKPVNASVEPHAGFNPNSPHSPHKVTQTGTAIGTPLYMAPEQALARPVDIRADVYALGIVLYELLAGAPPFSQAPGGQIFVEILTNMPPPISRAARYPVPPELDRFMAIALAKVPQERFPNLRAFAAELERM
jgi:serine/threonine-protein kinase